MVEQIHLQDGLLRAHGLDEKCFAHDLELALLADLRLGGQDGGIESALTQALLQARLFFADLAVDIFLRRVDGGAHISFLVFLLGTEERISAPDGHFDHAAVVSLHREGDVGLRFIFEIAIQLEIFSPRIP